jgi:hypothetical protein
MCIVKDLLTKDDLRHVRNALEILPEETPIYYEVWIIGYYNNIKVETLLCTFTESCDAIEYTNTITLLDAINVIAGNNRFSYDTDYVFIEVNSAIDNHRGGMMNLGTVYKNNLFLLEDII